MEWFQLIFPLVMILSPLVFVLCSGTSPQAGAAAKPLMHALWACTLGMVAVQLSLWYAGARTATFMGFAFMPLWFALAMPALMHRRPEWRRLHGSTPERTASLQPRHHEPLLPRWLMVLPSWVGLAGVVSVAAAVVMHRTQVGPLGPVDDASLIAAVLLVIGSEVLLFGLLPAITRAVRQMPEPEPAGGDASLREAYAKHRRFVACSMTLLFGVGMNAVAVAVASCLAWVPSTNPLRLTLLIVCGAGGGTLVGLGGAAIGTVSSLRRVRIAAQLHGLEAARSNPTH